VIARLGGDEFIALGLGALAGATSRIHKRLLHNLALHNKSQPVMPVAFSVGFASYNPRHSGQRTIERLMTEADQAMYAEKQSRRASRTFRGQGKTPCTELPASTN
jgi:diguanylate cyclase (GGDEF)-like protein